MKKVTRRTITIIGVILTVGGIGLLMAACLDEISFNALDLAGFTFIMLGVYLVFASRNSLLLRTLSSDLYDDEEDA